MTLKEIAQRAGVSVSTVSRIINSPDDSFARKSVRNKVWEIIRETGYIPNQSARELKRNKSETSSLHAHTLTCILGRNKNPEDNPFFAQVARAVEQQALSMGYVVSTAYSIFDIHNRALLQKIQSVKTDGAIILGRLDSKTHQFFDKYYKHIVYVGRNLIDAEWDQVICDGYEATQTALRHLIGSGHKRIGYIGETENEVRYQAYLDAVRENQLESGGDLIGRCQQDCTGGFSGASYLLKSADPLPTAVFCATDVTAIAAIKRFSEAGIKIPEQLSVVSMDDIELAQYVSPMLTTVSMPKTEMGKLAVRILIDRINKGHRLPMKVYLPHKLLIRESTARLE